jgi:hypothetical protein
MPTLSGPCHHCKRTRSLAARGLCHPCYKQPIVRRRYGGRPQTRWHAPDLNAALSPEMKAEIERRIGAYVRRAAAGLPLFEDAG